MEIHENLIAPSDGANMIPLAQLEAVLKQILSIRNGLEVAREFSYDDNISDPSCVSAYTGEALALDVDGVLWWRSLLHWNWWAKAI